MTALYSKLQTVGIIFNIAISSITAHIVILQETTGLWSAY